MAPQVATVGDTQAEIFSPVLTAARLQPDLSGRCTAQLDTRRKDTYSSALEVS